MKRRHVLVALGTLGLAGLGAGTAVGWERILRNLTHLERLEGFGRHPLARLRRHFAWLPVRPGVFEQYVADYERVYGAVHRLSIVRPDFYTRFLLSTDFFQTGAGTDTAAPPLTYRGLYEPLFLECSNPLAEPPPSDEELAAGGG